MHSPSALLLSLASNAGPPAPGRLNFEAAMQHMRLYSIFDVVRLSKSEFIESVSQYCDEDASQVYETAVSYAAQIEFHHREQRHSTTDKNRSKRKTSATEQYGASYATLFEDTGSEVCSGDSLAALDSPAAYVRALYLFALDIEKTGKGLHPKNTLDARRPTLKDMVIDLDAVNQRLPMLTLVNETLQTHIQLHLANNTPVYGTRSVEEVLAEKRFPFTLPFYLPREQCVLGLTGYRPMLGEINYKISTTLPTNQQAGTGYGKVQKNSLEAQKLLSALSPQQYKILTEVEADERTKDLFIQQNFNSTLEHLSTLSHFMERTELNTEALHEVLSVETFTPIKSVNVTTSAPHDTEHYSHFLTMGIRLDKTHNTQQLIGLDVTQLDRLQRVIRLHRWTNMSISDLKLLLHSTVRAQSLSARFTLNEHSVRALGVYRYLSQRYTLNVDEFCALLHRLPIHAKAQSASLYDRVFNNDQLFNASLLLDDSPLNLVSPDPDSLSCLSKIGASLALSPTPDSLGVLSNQVQKYIPSPKKDLLTLSSFYRQARIAMLFNLSVKESVQLAELLGGVSHSKQLTFPTLRSTLTPSAPDLLDVLMQMDWATQWFKQADTSIQKVRHQLRLETSQSPSAINEYAQQLDAAFIELERCLLADEEIPGSSLKSTLASANIKFSQGQILAKCLLKNFPSLPEYLDPDKSLQGLESAAEKLADGIKEPQAKEAVIVAIVSTLKPFLSQAYQRLLPWKGHLWKVFQDTTTPETSELFTTVYKHATYNMANALGNSDTRKQLKHSLLAMPGAVTALALPLSTAALQVFLLNPHWLDKANNKEAQLKLTFTTLYLFQQLKQMTQTYPITESDLINYLQFANALDGTTETDMTLRLSRLLGWAVSEIQSLLREVNWTRVQSVAQLEWIVRCQHTSNTTGLSAAILLTATNLDVDAPGDEWVRVGEAVMATAV